jgi:hypothetical protein
MEDIRILMIFFGVYGIAYCLYAISVVLANKEVQLRRFNQIKLDADKVNELYLHLVSRCDEMPRENLTIREMFEEISRLKRKQI